MPGTVQLRSDYDALRLRTLAKRSTNPRQIRRLLALAAVCWLLYAGYLMLRRAVEEPTRRATVAAVS